MTVGNYIVQTDYWNKGQCPGTQCVSIDDKTGSYTVTKEDFHCGNDYTVGSYPSILYGTAFGSTSPNSDLPAPLSALKCVNSSWSFEPTDTGGWTRPTIFGFALIITAGRRASTAAPS